MERPADEDDVRPVLVEHTLRGLSIRDTANNGNDDLIAEGSFDGGGEIDVKGFADNSGELLLRVVASRGDVEEVDAVFREEVCIFDSIVDRPRRLVREDLFETVCRRDTTSKNISALQLVLIV